MLSLPRGLNPKTEHVDSDDHLKRKSRRWVWTPLGFGEILHGTKEEREAARALTIAASLASPTPQQPSPLAVPSAAPAPPAAAPSSASSSSSSSSIPDAPPLGSPPGPPSPSSSPSTSRSKFLSLIQSSPANNANTPPHAVSLPPVAVAHIPPSPFPDMVIVHLLPHHTQPSLKQVIEGGSATPVPNAPMVVATSKENTHSTVKIRVSTFFDYSTLIRAEAQKDASKDALAVSLGKELRARKEKMDAERAAKAGGSDAASKAEQAAKEKAEKEAKEEAAKRANRVRKPGPPPSVAEIEIEVGDSVRTFIQKLLEFYLDYGVELDPDSIRLVNNGKEFGRAELPEIDSTLPSATLAAAAASVALNSTSGKDEPNEQLRGAIKKKEPKNPSSSNNNPNSSNINPSSGLRESLWHRLHPSAASWLGGAHSVKHTTQTERDRYIRAHTMIAESGLTQTIAKGSVANPSQVPVFDVLLVYDELSRFLLDVTTAQSDLTLTPDFLGATMTNSDNKWVTVRGTVSFTSGRHMWKVRFDRCTGGNAFVGVCNSVMKLSNYIGHDANGWGYYGCGNIYRVGSSSSYGSSYRTGDTITVKLDMDKKSLSFEKNDQPLGVAFTDLPELVYPAFSLYSKNDHLQLIEFGTF